MGSIVLVIRSWGGSENVANLIQHCRSRHNGPPMPMYPQVVVAMNPGGTQTAMGVTAPGLIKTFVTPGFASVLYRIIVVQPGTSGLLTANDSATIAGSNASNTLISAPYSILTQGQVIPILATCLSGIMLSSVPTGGVFTVTYC